MLKKYFWAMSLIIPVSLALVFLGWLGFLPFSESVFFLVFFLLLMGVAFFWPREFFWFFLASLPLENVFLTPDHFPFSLRLYQVAGTALFLVLILRKIIKKEKLFLNFCFWKSIFEKKDFDWLGVGVFSWLVLFSLGGWNGVSSSENVKWFLIVASFVFLFWLARNFLRSGKEKAEGLFFFLLGGVTVWLAGVYQILAVEMGWGSFVVMAGRINGTFLEPDWLGIYWAFFLGLLLGLKIFFAHWEPGQKLFAGKWNLKKFLNGILNVKIFFLGMMLAMTVSRSAWLATLVVLASYAFLLWRGNDNAEKAKFSANNFLRGAREVMTVGLILVLSFVTVKLLGFSDFDFLNRASSTVSGEQKITISCKENRSLPERVESIDDLSVLGCRHINLEEIQPEKNRGFFVGEINRPDPNVDIRKNIYETVWQEGQKHPWLGQGWGASSRILGQDEQGNGLNASNIFLEIWLSAGILGLFGFGFVLFWALKTILEMPKSIQGFFLLSGVAYLTANLFNAGIFSGFFWIWLASINFSKK